jgi:hypothetical protein
MRAAVITGEEATITITGNFGFGSAQGSPGRILFFTTDPNNPNAARIPARVRFSPDGRVRPAPTTLPP